MAESMQGRLQPLAITLAQVAFHLPMIAQHCSAMPDIDVLDDESVRLGWCGGHANSFALHFSPGRINVILSEPKAGPGWGKTVDFGNAAALQELITSDDATPFLRRYGSPSAGGAQDQTGEKNDG